jgi:tetratricopeptide (TPR) repeat protein
VRLASAYTTYKLQHAGSAAESLQARQPLAIAQAYRGHLAEAYGAVGSENPLVFAELAMAGGVPRDSADAAFTRWAQPPNQLGPWTITWAGARRDTTLLLQIQKRLDGAVGHIPPAAPPIARDFVGYLIESSKAYLALVRGDSANALSRFLALPDSACFTFCPLDALERVQLLEALGRPQEALAWLERQPASTMLPPLPSDVLGMLVRGRLQERLGQRDKAIEAYAYVAAVWARADSVLQPYVAEARAGLTRLGAERKR